MTRYLVSPEELGVDAGVVIQRLLDNDLPIGNDGYGITWGGTEIVLPIGSYPISTRVLIPASKSLSLLSESAIRGGTRLVWGGAAGNMIRHGAGWHSLVLRGLMLEGAGVDLEAQARGDIRIESCSFKASKGYAVRTLGSGVVDVSISGCRFSEGGISVGFDQSDLWRVDHCTFVRSTAPDLYVATNNLRAIDCDFEQRDSFHLDIPYIHIRESSHDIVLRGCRFGNETQPPADSVLIGPAATITSARAFDITLDSCSFMGTSAPTEVSGRSAIRLSCPVSGLRVNGGRVGSYQHLIREDYLSPSQLQGGRIAGPNMVTGLPPDLVTFSRGGHGFEQIPAGIHTVHSSTTELLGASWISTAATWQQVGSSPLEYKLTSLGGSAYMKLNFTPPVAGADLYISVIAKADTCRSVRIGFMAGGIMMLIGRSIPLSSSWREHQIRIPAELVAAGIVYLAVGGDPSVAGDSILIRRISAICG